MSTYYQRHKEEQYPIIKLRSLRTYYRTQIKKLEEKIKDEKQKDIEINFLKAKIDKFKDKEQELNEKLTTMKTSQT